VGQVVDRIRAEQGRLDVVVNNVFNSTDFAKTIGVRFWEAPDLWDQLIGFSLSAIYIVNAKAAPLLIETAARTKATTLIVNVSGRGALNHRYNVAYGVGKSATERFTRDMALELREHDVAVVSIWPNGVQKQPMETDRYSGRSVVGLLADPRVFDKTGKYFWCASLGEEYGFTDEFGHTHPVGNMVDSFSLDRA
jgi:NAD(P)-dependent dehydrogenase (short-subunit alcohol dehydrogenase family)